MTSHQPFEDARVREVFQAYPSEIRSRLMALRRLIFETAATAGVGPLQETLKWGQPSYLTPATRSGSTIRLDRAGTENHAIALYFHCQTALVATFKEIYPDAFTYRGNRAILIGEDDEIAEAPLRHCIALALTYHRRSGRTPAAAGRRPSAQRSRAR